ncbi:Redox-sensitive transcriptional activator SoxR [Pelagimonas phthalicica]|uniref:Redox-sensitive transcriptional activator SoxR n=1 Tax=Pelagimonas phthalicica TaxID=1037362 RepID=A0A238JDZ6_9RHOB|nr:redox-sensitive transcriptional activator SoxR [Pelagimonas phthalicica]TDS91811.1 MerR family transcriptional regulator [Pelagimonas phthalicica]SMX28859.1 Redox-sensitive transcriptional activator SoxR [Pelagimonas phthalicica]
MRARDLTIGQVADRTGLAASAIRHYESEGLVHPYRNASGQRRFLRSDIRRLSFILIAQQLGFTLTEIREQLAPLPANKGPTKSDWSRMSRRFGKVLDERIAMMNRLRDRLDGCIGCGCLSLENCELYNNEDRLAKRGTGPRYVIDEAVDDTE